MFYILIIQLQCSQSLQLIGLVFGQPTIGCNNVTVYSVLHLTALCLIPVYLMTPSNMLMNRLKARNHQNLQIYRQTYRRNARKAYTMDFTHN